MALRQIIPCTDPLMRAVSSAIEEITDEVKTLAADMVETMLAVDGVGLAAIQVGEPVRMFVMLDVPGATALPTPASLGSARRLVLINPSITQHSEDTLALPEGCLSMPGVYFPVDRWSRVVVGYIDLAGEPQQIEGFGYKAICLQHELDHLDGIRNIDRVSPLKRAMLMKRFESNRRAVGHGRRGA